MKIPYPDRFRIKICDKLLLLSDIFKPFYITIIADEQSIIDNQYAP